MLLPKIKKSGGWTWTTHRHPTWTTGTNQKVNLSILEMLSGNGNLPESEWQESNLRHIAYKATALPLSYIPCRLPRLITSVNEWDDFHFAQHINDMLFVLPSSPQDKHQPFPMGLIRLNHRPPVHWQHRTNELICRRRIRTAVLKDMSLVRFHFSILP